MNFSMSALSSKLRARRAELDISQAELADISGISLAAINSYENEGYVPGADKLCQLAKALGTDPNYLLSWD